MTLRRGLAADSNLLLSLSDYGMIVNYQSVCCRDNQMIPTDVNILDSYLDDMKPDPSWSFEEVTTSDTRKWTHGYHRYPAKFIPQLVEKLLDDYAPGSNLHINDPFMGSGTTIVCGLARGHRVSGTDVNGIAELITRVKATPLEPEYLSKHVEQLFGKIVGLGFKGPTLIEDYAVPFIPKNHEERIDYWFPEDVKGNLGKILRHIHNENELEIRSFLLVAFSHILKKCSMWCQGSTKPIRDVKRKPSSPLKEFTRHVERMTAGNSEYWNNVPPEVRDDPASYLNLSESDARRQALEDESVDLVISSSPYVTSYEYADLHELSTIWLDLAQDIKSYRKKFIGTARKVDEDIVLESSLGLRIVEAVREESSRLADRIYAFFADMEDVFRENRRVLKPGGRCCYVIGDTLMKGISIRNAEVFIDSMRLAGLDVERVIKRRIPAKILPQFRDMKTGRFAHKQDATSEAYPVEYIVIARK